MSPETKSARANGFKTLMVEQNSVFMELRADELQTLLEFGDTWLIDADYWNDWMKWWQEAQVLHDH